MEEKAVAVLGGGAGAQTMAADIKLAGRKVYLYELPEFRDRIRSLIESRQVELGGMQHNLREFYRGGLAELDLVTTKIEEVMDADLINIVVPAVGQEEFFRRLVPNLEDGKTIVLWPGNFGSLILYRMVKEEGLNVVIGEANTLPYGTRLAKPGQVILFLRTRRIMLAAMPDVNTKKLMESLKDFPPLDPCEVIRADTVLSAAFSNPNPVVHPVASLLNTGAIELSAPEYYLYRDGISRAVAIAIKAVYNEFRAVAGSIGIRMAEYDERAFMRPSTIMGEEFAAPFNTDAIIAGIVGPTGLNDRYFVEDIPYGLVPVYQLGKKFGVKTPVTESVIRLGSLVCRTDFLKSGRSLDKLGIEKLAGAALLKYLKRG